MNLYQALEFRQKKLDEGYLSDGCTFAPDLGITKFCEMHDFLIRFDHVSILEADNLLFEGIVSKGLRYFPIAALYWLAVRWSALFNHQIIPSLMFVVALIFILTILDW